MIYFLLICGIIGLIFGLCSIRELNEAEKDITRVDFGEYLIYGYGASLLTPASVGVIIVSIILIFTK